MDCIIISGQSGSGKSVALRLLEDIGYYCVDNLPLTLLPQLIEVMKSQSRHQIAVSIDVRGRSINDLPHYLQQLAALDVAGRLLFLTARDDVLLKRFSESRRRHPLSAENTTLLEAIQAERQQLQAINSLGHQIDTSDILATTLRTWVSQFATQPLLHRGFTLYFESFGFKYGLPLDADLVFDIRCLPNPYYVDELRPFTGKDAAIVGYLEQYPDVINMRNDIAGFISRWLQQYRAEQRTYLTIAIGCTGGQHRSVYMVEWLCRHFQNDANTLVRHRQL